MNGFNAQRQRGTGLSEHDEIYVLASILLDRLQTVPGVEDQLLAHATDNWLCHYLSSRQEQQEDRSLWLRRRVHSIAGLHDGYMSWQQLRGCICSNYRKGVSAAMAEDAMRQLESDGLGITRVNGRGCLEYLAVAGRPASLTV